jgi:hypothetical protein
MGTQASSMATAAEGTKIAQTLGGSLFDVNEETPEINPKTRAIPIKRNTAFAHCIGVLHGRVRSQTVAVAARTPHITEKTVRVICVAIKSGKKATHAR